MTYLTRLLVLLSTLPAIASAQTDTTRRRDTATVRPPQDTTRRVQESRGETELGRPAERFGVDKQNYGFSAEQATELQQTLNRTGCDVGDADGVVGRRTLLGIACFRTQHNLETVDFEAVLTALNVSYAAPPPPPPEPPPKREPVLPPVLRPDSNYRPDVRARRDSVRRDSVRKDSVRRDSVRRDSTARRDTTRSPAYQLLRLFGER